MALISLLLAAGTVHTVEAATFRLDGQNKAEWTGVTWGETPAQTNSSTRSLDATGKEVPIPPRARWILVRSHVRWGEEYFQHPGGRFYQFLIERPAGKNVHVKITVPFIRTWRLKPIGKVKNNISGKKIKMLKNKDHIAVIMEHYLR